MAKTFRFISGLLLLPFIAAEALAIFGLVPDAFVPDFPFFSGEIVAFMAGMAIWCAISWRIDVNNWFYVFGHELTHAAWATLTFSKVSKISVTSKGGYCLINNPGPLTTLSPYFIPFYVVVLLLIRLLLGIWFDMAPYARWWLGALGFAYAFHVTNTISSLVKVAQPDIRAYGRFFSCVFIVVVNLLILGFGMAAMTATPMREWLGGLANASSRTYGATWRFIAWAVGAAFNAITIIVGKIR